MGITIFGGMLLQYPIGKLSDIIKRRTVISALGVFSAIIAILMLIMAPYYSIFSGLLFLFGGLTFTMYPVGISHTCDRVESKDIVSATQGLLLAYSLGAMIGPVIAPIFISIFGSSGLMIYFVLLSILLGVFAAWRKTQTEAPLEEDKQDFAAAMPLTPVAVELDPRAEEDNLDNTQNN
jgi:MFS family permease